MNESLKQRMKNEQMSRVCIDMFSGLGGMCTGFKWTGILPLIAVEWADTTIETYSATLNTDVLGLEEYMADEVGNAEYLNTFMQENTQTLVIHGDINIEFQDIKRYCS
ncbi:DNA cytosine methyltransferase [Traorella massiliensis]|uniref:DNA cytosine methyltransferase n=1 Tax=Traorella massiliensis TaxID=1903263 RepID=UPI0023536E48|nr:DNA cytosine methyltransferase [Traorella massiliensis]